MQEHEDGYCDSCGADMRDFPAQLTVDGRELCITCATDPKVIPPRYPNRRDDGR